MKANASLKRDFLMEAGQEVEDLVRENPDLDRHQLRLLSATARGAAFEWLEGESERAKDAAFARLLRWATTETSDGQKVRLLQSYRKVVQDKDGKERQLHLWKHLEQMTRDECVDSISGQISHAVGCVNNANAVAKKWNELHPAEDAIKQRSFVLK